MTSEHTSTLEHIVERKNFFVDTCSLMQNPWSVFRLTSSKIPKEMYDSEKQSALSLLVKELDAELKDEKPNNVYISSMVEWELNNIKDDSRKDPVTQFNARAAIDIINKIRKYGDARNQSIETGIKLENEAIIKLVDHDEEQFLQHNKKLYQPTRDDRILADYSGFIKNIILDYISQEAKIDKALIVDKKDIVSKKSEDKSKEFHSYEELVAKYKHKLDGVFQIITEDHSFEGKGHSFSGKFGVKIDCNPLFSERTKDPNPAASYTGIYPIDVVLPNEVYKTIMDKSSGNQFKLEFLVKNFAKKNVDINLCLVHPNQFIKIVPESLDSVENLVEYYLVKTKSGEFKKLIHYQKFDDEEFGKRAQSLEQKRPKSLDFLLQDVGKMKYLVKKLSMEKKTRTHIYTLIDKQRDPNSLNQALTNITSEMRKNEVSLDKALSLFNHSNDQPQQQRQNYSRESILNRSFNQLIRPRGKQILYVEHLQNPAIGIVSYIAPMGMGKTYFALACAIKQLREGLYDQIIYIRQPVETGMSVGFLPGAEDKKVEGYMEPCTATINDILGLDQSPHYYREHPYHTRMILDDAIYALRRQKLLDLRIPNKISGISRTRTFCIVDEAHQINKHLFKLIQGRFGKGSKIVWTGDFEQLESMNYEGMKQIGVSSPRKAGISHAIEKYPYNDKVNLIYGHVSVLEQHSERSDIAEAALLL